MLCRKRTIIRRYIIRAVCQSWQPPNLASVHVECVSQDGRCNVGLAEGERRTSPEENIPLGCFHVHMVVLIWLASHWACAWTTGM